ncbi:MAG TPA: ISL3 family transposase [Candidatus Hodarchaeales archaeon]|nr:ISL3 family transposase [Candidatus Hodarchaeales archaeon]
MSYSSGIVSLFHVPGCLVRDVEVTSTEILVHVRKRRITAVCPQCGKRTGVVHQRHIRKLLHTLVGTVKVFLLLTRRRFVCSSCNLIFAEDLSFLDGRKRRTKQLAESIVSRLKKESFRSTTEAIGVSYAGLRDCLIHVVDPFMPNWSEKERSHPFSLGIDEHYARRNRYVLSVTNLTARKPITFLPSDRIPLLVRFLRSIPPGVQANIEEVCCDMKEGFIQTALRELPKATVVIDHFHVIQDANNRVQEARKIEQYVARAHINWKVFTKNEEHLSPAEHRVLHIYCQSYPILHCFWRVKEELRDIYRSPTRDHAAEKLKHLRLRMEALDIIELKLWARSLRRHEPYILNFWNNKTTNAYTEGIHVKCKLTQRISFGFRNIDVYIRKAMLAFLPLAALLNYHRY